MKPCLIIFDIDETLYDNHLKQIPASTLTAIDKLKKAGHTLAVATGRSLFELIPQVKDLPFDFFILANGQLAIKNNEIIYDEAIDPEIVKELMAEANRVGTHLGFNSATHSSVTGLTPQMQEAFEKYYTTMPEVSSCIKKHGAIYQMWYLSEDITHISEKFKDRLRFLPWLNNGADVVPVGASKAMGLTKTLEILGTSLPEEIIFFGDGINDIELVEMASIGVAMGNAVPALKAVADYITTDITENGIYHGCDILGLFTANQTDSDIDDQIVKLEANIATGVCMLDDYFHLKTLYSSYKKQPYQSLQHLKKALTNYPHEVSLLLEMATFYEFELENVTKAKMYYEQVLKINPDHLLAKNALNIINKYGYLTNG